jgi:citrate synthase
MAQKTEQHMIGSRQTAELLGVSLRTLYSYVSRGKVSRTIDEASGDSLFNQAEIKEYVRRRDRGRSPKTAARTSLNFGLPVLDSHICAIKAGRPWFRGVDAIAYSDTATLEDTAALLWNVDSVPREHEPLQVSHAETGSYASRLGQWLLAQTHRPSADDGPERTRHILAAARILRAAVSLAVESDDWSGAIHEALGHAWRLPARSHDVLRRTLVLHADHELNPSSFVVRCTASTLASPYAATLAGCCAASGTRHASFSGAYRLIGRIRKGDDAARLLEAYESAGTPVPGFNHPLYPKGDPRATAILASLREACPDIDMSFMDSFLNQALSRRGLLPKNDFAMAAVVHVLGLPEDACTALFLIARVVGWNAHALEQYDMPILIRPRAHYVPD